jgi:porin
VSFLPKAGTAQDTLTVQDWVKRPEMLGDWGGLRTKMGERGLKIGVTWTQFFQWSPTSQDTRGWDYGGKLDVRATQDFANMNLEGVTATTHIEFRYGDTPLFAGGTLVPTNTALLFPESEGAKAQISSLYVSKMFGASYGFEAGRFNMVDRYEKPFSGGQGLDNFTNMAFVKPPLLSRTTPGVAEGVFFKTMKNAEPFVTVGLYESTEEGFFKNGATFLASVALPLKIWETPSHYVFTATASSVTANSFDQSDFVLIPGVPPNASLVQESNAWTFDFSFDQYLWWDPATKTGFGLFGMIGASDSNPSPLDIFGHLGIGGNSPIPNRSQDNFGAGYYFAGVSNTLTETLLPAIRLRDENGFEGFYNVAITGWSKVSAHFQFVDPFVVGSKTRGFFSIRWKLTF